MNYHELQEKTDTELRLLLAEKRVALKDLRFKAASGQLKSVREIRATRELIARLLTLLNNRQKK
ncbi:MAG TPA: 50S ribosomal protein L29 [Patescibacteria group bacterium]|jgi:ribosomal protein L29|nr:50S ribosomal protein L29 [bacterium]HRT10934.1 50S ribosomal protein L29 [Patescibacteria group bacterium]HRU89785.1 50S ribosomal protein L29 [Patescibacteria group bacterium]